MHARPPAPAARVFSGVNSWPRLQCVLAAFRAGWPAQNFLLTVNRLHAKNVRMPDTEPVNPGVKVRIAREAAGLSQQSLASRASLAVRTVARVEAGEDSTLGTFRAIAEALGVPVADLIVEAAA